MNRDDENLVLWIAGAWFLTKYFANVVPALERGGAKLYDILHDDAGHKQDLPGHQLTRSAVLQIATMAGFPDPKLASAIAFAESGGVPGAQVQSSREWSVGLWQINIYAHPMFTVAELRDPMKNAMAALQISDHGKNWQPWSTFTNGAYLKFRTGVFAP